MDTGFSDGSSNDVESENPFNDTRTMSISLINYEEAYLVLRLLADPTYDASNDAEYQLIQGSYKIENTMQSGNNFITISYIPGYGWTYGDDGVIDEKPGYDDGGGSITPMPTW